MANALVVFYSYTGTSRKLAQLLAAQQGWPLGEVVELASRADAGGAWRCGLSILAALAFSVSGTRGADGAPYGLQSPPTESRDA